MKKRVRLTNKQKVDIIEAYNNDLEPMIAIAERYGVTRQGIHKLLKRAGVDTSKHKIPVSCTVCGNQIMRTKGRIRQQLNHFCGHACYKAYLQAGNGSPLVMNRHQSRVARTLVSQYFSLQAGNIVHHENRNQTDNGLENLRVFANQGDHLRHHRGFDVNPIWDGRF